VIAAFLVLQAKANRQYVATSQIFVNAPSGPFLRTTDIVVTRQNPRTRVVRTPRGTGTGPTTSVRTVPSPPSVVSEAPNTDTLVNAANLYPLLIESDEVAAIKPVPPNCKIESTGVFASTNTFGVFKASPVPVVSVRATCDVKANAIPAATDRVDGFKTWVVTEQNRQKIPLKQRLLVQKLTTPTEARTINGPSAGLPVFVGLCVFLLFCGIAILLDRPRPEKDEKMQQQKEPRPAKNEQQVPPPPQRQQAPPVSRT
jgi:hypothetical protein